MARDDQRQRLFLHGQWRSLAATLPRVGRFAQCADGCESSWLVSELLRRAYAGECANIRGHANSVTSNRQGHSAVGDCRRSPRAVAKTVGRNNPQHATGPCQGKAMNVNSVVNRYKNLTPEERFRLILAASGRGDESERDRLVG